MFSESVSEKLKKKAWASDWPSLPGFDEVSIAPALSPCGWWEPWTSLIKQAAALHGKEPAIALSCAQSFLESLSLWNAHSASILTWPPSTASFAQALDRSIRERDPRVLCVLALYPQVCADVLLQHGYAPKSQDNGFVDTSEKLVFQLISWRRSVLEKSITPSPPQPPSPDNRHASPELLPWLQETLNRLRSQNQPQDIPILREWFDEHWKELRSSERCEARPHWFEEKLLPALARLDRSDQELWLKFWSPHKKLAISSPEKLVDQKKFWAILRDAVDGSFLMSDLLPAVIDHESWTFEQRYEMLDPMFRLAKSNAKVFEDRLRLWQGWGGRLDETAVIPQGQSDNAALFSNPPNLDPVMARTWFESHGNEMWNRKLSEFPASVSRNRSRP